MYRGVVIFFLFASISIHFNLSHADEKITYLLYGINELEGFNLRRDVYIRLSNIIRILRDPNQHPQRSGGAPFKALNWKLVLPPFGILPHWRRHGDQDDKINRYPVDWATFFDIPSLNSFIPVIEWKDFIHEVFQNSEVRIDASFHVTKISTLNLMTEQNYSIKAAEVKESLSLFCDDEWTTLTQTADGNVTGFYQDAVDTDSFPIKSSSLQCLSGILEANRLTDFLSEFLETHPFVKCVYIGSAEALIHGVWSEWSQEYWTSRRSMTFAKHLRDIGDAYRTKYLNSDDTRDQTEPPSSWMYQPWPLAPAVGGPYVAVHWRRGDFVHHQDGLSQYSPDPIQASMQIMEAVKLFGLLDEVKLHNWPIYIATDADIFEFNQLKKYLHPVSVVRFVEANSNLLPGEVAIVDQWICAHARLFIGTNPSTFTLRITEERQLMDFPEESTFNTLCGQGYVQMHKKSSKREDCEAITAWSVNYEARYTIPLRYQQQHARAAWASSGLDHNPEEL